LLSLVTFAKAQTNETAKAQDAAVLTTMAITKLLDLTADQQVKVKAIYLEKEIALEKLKVDGQTDEPAMKKLIKEANDVAERKLYLILDDSQKEKLKQLKAAAKANGK